MLRAWGGSLFCTYKGLQKGWCGWTSECQAREAALGHSHAGLGLVLCEGESRATGGETADVDWRSDCVDYIFRWPLLLLLWEEPEYGREVVQGLWREMVNGCSLWSSWEMAVVLEVRRGRWGWMYFEGRANKSCWEHRGRLRMITL